MRDKERKTELLNKTENWTEIKNKCRTTVNKEHSDVQATKDFIYNLLISEHSPIRLFNIDFKWDNIPYFVSTQFARHTWEKFISTSREDRTGVDRSQRTQVDPVTFEGNMNAQHLIDTARKRLCYQCSPETRELMEDLKRTLHENGEEQVANTLCPNCIYRCGCPEFEECGFWKKFKKIADNENIDITEIKSRYELYNRLFFKA